MELHEWNSSREQTLVVSRPDTAPASREIADISRLCVLQISTAPRSHGVSTSLITEDERAALSKWARSRTSPARLVLRGRIVLLAADGLSTTAIARRLGTTIKTVVLWRRRFAAGGIAALAKDASGRGRKRAIPIELANRVLTGLCEGLGVRELARRVGISPASVVRFRDRAL